MQDQYEALLAIAEVAATFAGFAALVTLFARRRVAASMVHDLLRLRLVIGGSVATVLAALIPVGLSGYGITDYLVWRIASVLFLLLICFVCASFVSAYQPVRGTFPPDVLAVSVAAGAALLVVGGLLAVLFGFFSNHHHGLYLSALIGMIGLVAFVFLRLVESTFGNFVPPPD